MKMSDYIKIEEIKYLLMYKLAAVGLEEKLKDLPEDKMNNLIKFMYNLNQKVEDKEGEERIEFLLFYILSLVVILIKDYDFDINSL